MSITDEQLGAAIRRIATRLWRKPDPDAFQWYAQELVKAADMLEAGTWTPDKLSRIRVWVDPEDEIDGLIERWLEMLTGFPVGVTGFDKLGSTVDGTPEKLAQLFHEIYERLAPEHGYETRPESAKPWTEVPEQNRQLMIAVCSEILTKTAPHDPDLEKLRAAMERLREATQVASEILNRRPGA